MIDTITPIKALPVPKVMTLPIAAKKDGSSAVSTGFSSPGVATSSVVVASISSSPSFSEVAGVTDSLGVGVSTDGTSGIKSISAGAGAVITTDACEAPLRRSWWVCFSL